MNKISSQSGLNYNSMYKNLTTQSFDEKQSIPGVQKTDEEDKKIEYDHLMMKQKSTYVESDNPAALDYDLQNDEFVLDQQKLDQKHDLFQLDQQSNDPVQIFQRGDDVSEPEDELFSPKTHYIKTDIGSPNVDYLPKQFKTLVSLKELQIYIKENFDISPEQTAKKAQMRRQRVERYLLKKQNRCYTRRIAYHSRKTVAESRLRVKGRFITKAEAQKILQTDLSRLCNKQIKQLLELHYSITV